jgi:hypothetical protein
LKADRFKGSLPVTSYSPMQSNISSMPQARGLPDSSSVCSLSFPLCLRRSKQRCTGTTAPTPNSSIKEAEFLVEVLDLVFSHLPRKTVVFLCPLSRVLLIGSRQLLSQTRTRLSFTLAASKAARVARFVEGLDRLGAGMRVQDVALSSVRPPSSITPHSDSWPFH